MNKIKFTFDAFNNQAQEYQDKFMNLNLYDESYDLFYSHITKKKSDILDIGCGPGNITRYLLDKRPDFKITGIDLAPNMLDLAKKNNPAAEFLLMDCRNINSIKKKFDGIVIGFCIPYLSKNECAKLISDCKKLLNENGTLYFSVIEGNYNDSGFQTSSNDKGKAFVHYYDEIYINSLLEKNDFDLYTFLRIDYEKSADHELKHIVFIARKK